MKKYSLLIAFLFFLFLTFPLYAGEELMTKLFFDKWLDNTTGPLEKQVEQLQKSFAVLETQINELRELMGTEIKITINQHLAYIDGRQTELEAAPVIVNGRTMVPVRFIGEALGASFLWDEQSRKVSYIYKDMLIEIFIDKQQAYVNKQQEVILDAAPFITNGRTLVPLRFVSENLGASVDWDEVTRTVTITY